MHPCASVAIRAAAMAMEITIYRRAPSFTKLEMPWLVDLGTRISVTISPGASAVFRLPRTNASTASCREPAWLVTTTFASSAISGGTPSAAGEALHRLPATVARFWICTEPTSRAACCKAWNAGGRSAAMISLQQVSAPMRQYAPSQRMPRNPSMAVTSSMGAVTGRSRKPGKKSVPPAKTVQSPVARSDKASPIDLGRA